MPFDHHRLSGADFQITTTFTFESCFRFLPGECCGNTVSNSFTHRLGEHTSFREWLSICHRDLHYISNSINTWELSLQRARIRRDPTRIANQSAFAYDCRWTMRRYA